MIIVIQYNKLRMEVTLFPELLLLLMVMLEGTMAMMIIG